LARHSYKELTPNRHQNGDHSWLLNGSEPPRSFYPTYRGRRPRVMSGRRRPLCSILGRRPPAVLQSRQETAAALHLRQEMAATHSGCRSLFVVEAKTLAIEEQRAEPVLVEMPVAHPFARISRGPVDRTSCLRRVTAALDRGSTRRWATLIELFEVVSPCIAAWSDRC
jgi:hypothetical protein